MESFKLSCDVSMIPCGHIFHTSCTNKRIGRGHKDCPRCRKSWPKVLLKKIFLFTLSNDLEQDLHQAVLRRNELTKEKQQLETQLDEAKKRVADLTTERHCWIKYLKWLCNKTENPFSLKDDEREMTRKTKPMSTTKLTNPHVIFGNPTKGL